MKKLLNLSCFLLLFIVQGQTKNMDTEPQFSIEVSNTSVLLGNYFQVTFTLKNGDGNKFEAPTFNDFDIVSGPNQSSSFSMMNGVTTQSISYTYYLQPKDVGNYYVEPAFIEVDGKTLETQPIEILVLENPDGIIEKPKSKSPRQMEFFNFPPDDFFNFPSDDFFNFPKIEIPEYKEQPKENGNDENGKEKPKKKRKKAKSCCG